MTGGELVSVGIGLLIAMSVVLIGSIVGILVDVVVEKIYGKRSGEGRP